jgi:hypothetical protein
MKFSLDSDDVDIISYVLGEKLWRMQKDTKREQLGLLIDHYEKLIETFEGEHHDTKDAEE